MNHEMNDQFDEKLRVEEEHKRWRKIGLVKVFVDERVALKLPDLVGSFLNFVVGFTFKNEDIKFSHLNFFKSLISFKRTYLRIAVKRVRSKTPMRV